MSDAEDPAAQSDRGSNDEQAIIDGRITFAALLKNVCGLNQREVSAITASGITSLSDMRRLKAKRFDNMFVQIWKERHAKGPGRQNRMSHDPFCETRYSTSRLFGRKLRSAMRLDVTLKTFEMSV
jgi:hypothetical protein